MEIKNRFALITGSAKRIGKEIAISLAKDGCNVIVHYNSSEKEAEEVRKLAEGYGVKAFKFKANLEKTEEVLRLIEDIKKEVRKVDILVNNASIYYPTKLDEITDEDFDRFYGIHVKAPFYLSREFGKLMKESGEGRIINIVDYSAIKPYPDFIPYTASKGALLTMTKAFAKELAPEVLVNAVLPGPIIPPEDLKEEDIPLRKTVLKKWGGVAEIYKAVKYFIDSDFTTGAFLPVEGGRLIY